VQCPGRCGAWVLPHDRHRAPSAGVVQRLGAGVTVLVKGAPGWPELARLLSSMRGALGARRALWPISRVGEGPSTDRH